MWRIPFTTLCTAIPTAFTADRSPSTMRASRRFDRLILPEAIHHRMVGSFHERGAATRTSAAAQLSSVATKLCKTTGPVVAAPGLQCGIRIRRRAPIEQWVPVPLVPALMAATRPLRRAHSFSWSLWRCAESRGVIVGKRRPANESTIRERFRSSQLIGQVSSSNFRSSRGSRARALISPGSLTANISTIPGIRNLFNCFTSLFLVLETGMQTSGPGPLKRTALARRPAPATDRPTPRQDLERSEPNLSLPSRDESLPSRREIRVG